MEKFTKQELNKYIELASRLHTLARVIDPVTCRCQMEELLCFRTWQKKSRCENCVSAHAVRTGNITTKFEFMPNKEIYYVVSTPVELEDGTVVAVETVNQINDDTLIGAYGHTEFANHIIQYNEALNHDSGTGLFNRKYLQEQLDTVKLAKKSKVSVIMCDIDDFKLINDQYGHIIGDEVLIEIGRALEYALGDGVNGFVSRFGGDEFVLVIFEQDKDFMAALVEEIRHNVKKVAEKYKGRFQVSLSVGMASLEDGITIEELLDRADHFMYLDKEQHKHRGV